MIKATFILLLTKEKQCPCILGPRNPQTVAQESLNLERRVKRYSGMKL
jgi:hypothetical protein